MQHSRARKSLTVRSKPFDYGTFSQSDRETLRVCVGEVASLTRKSCEQVIELGRILARAQPVVAGKFKHWVRIECGITDRTARNYLRVAERFGGRLDVVERLAVPPTMLIKLATADDWIVESVLTRVGDGETLTVADVAELVRKPRQKASEASPERHGRAGLEADLLASTREFCATWMKELQAVVTAIEQAMPNDSRKRVIKSQLHGKIRQTCLRMTCSLCERSGRGTAEWPKGRWSKAVRALGQLANYNWPKREKFEPWLRDDVLPALRWVLTGDEDNDGDDAEPEVNPEMQDESMHSDATTEPASSPGIVGADTSGFRRPAFLNKDAVRTSSSTHAG